MLVQQLLPLKVMPAKMLVAAWAVDAVLRLRHWLVLAVLGQLLLLVIVMPQGAVAAELMAARRWMRAKISASCPAEGQKFERIAFECSELPPSRHLDV